MKKLLHATYFLVVAWCISLVGMSSANASHIQGGQLTYEALGNNRYKVSLTVFRDCGGAAFSSIQPELDYRTTGCTGGTSVDMVLVGNPEAGSPYCANTPGGPSQCGSGLRTNYQKGTFEVTVTLPPAAEWILSVTLNARPSVANINLGNGDLYYEARLNNMLPGNRIIQNTSAQYQALDIPIPFVCYQQERTVTFSANEPDGDSLVYTLANPLLACGEPNTYRSYTTVGRFIDLTPPNGTPCGAYIVNNSGTYSATYPISSFNVTGACPLKTATPAFNFNAAQGSFTFTPSFFNPAVNSADNKYVVVGQVTEYRRFLENGKKVYHKVGQVRRDMMIVVIDCNNNNQPTPPVGTGFDKSGVTIVNSRDSTFVTAYTCNYTEVRFRFSDPNPGDILTVSYPELDPPTPTLAKPTYLPADVATFQLVGNGTKAPAGILRIQPDILFEGKTYRIPLKIEDNGCPFKGIQFRTIVLKIGKGNFAKVLATSANPTICEGASVALTATPYRPDSVGLRPASYGYKWEAAEGLATADLGKQIITVKPTKTTRYRVRILGQDFREGTCSDTASVLVRVTPALVANFTTTSRGDNSGRTNIQARIFTFKNTTTNAVAAKDSVRWTYQRMKDGKGNTVNEKETIFSRKYDPAELILREGGQYAIKMSIYSTVAGAQCATSEKVTLIDVRDIPNMFTPNGDKINDNFVLTADEEGSKIQIFNRWGRLIKEYSNYKGEWDGKDQPAGTYYYLLTGKDGKTTKGWVELAR